MKESVNGHPRSEIKSRLQEFSKSQWEPYDTPLTGRVCHYTSWAALNGMLSSGTLWLSDIATMNDASEFIYFRDVLRPILNRKSVPSEVKERIFQTPRLFSFATAWFAYATSFCQISDKLEQWDRYAERGEGVALSFSLEPLRLSGAPDIYGVVGLIYDAEEQIRLTTSAIDDAIQYSRELGVAKKDHLVFWFEVVMCLLQCAVRFKHPAFREEEEIRALALRPERTGSKTRADGRGSSRHFIEVSFPASAFDGVWLGPRSPRAVSEVEEVLARYNLKVPVLRSRIPLR